MNALTGPESAVGLLRRRGWSISEKRTGLLATTRWPKSPKILQTRIFGSDLLTVLRRYSRCKIKIFSAKERAELYSEDLWTVEAVLLLVSVIIQFSRQFRFEVFFGRRISDLIFSDLLRGELFRYLIFFFQSVMDDRTFVLWRGQQRINFNENDLTAERISAVFRVSIASLFN